MRAEILSIGAELLIGDIVDTNAAFLGRELTELGFTVGRITTVGDDMRDLVPAFRSSCQASKLIVATGGLGPTPDDLTREAVAELLGEVLEVSPELEAELRAYFAGRGVRMPEANVKQATLIPSAQPLPNPVGTAPGWWVATDDIRIALMPGVPTEMKVMWREQVAPRLRFLTDAFVVTRTLKTWGLGESTVAQMLGLLWESTNPTLGTYAKIDGVQVRITATAASSEEAERLLSDVEAEARAKLGDHIWGVDDDDLAMCVAQQLEARQLTLTTYESASQGMLATKLMRTGTPAFVGGVVRTGDFYAADLLLDIGEVERSERAGREWFSTEVMLSSTTAGQRVEVVEVPSEEQLPERSAVSALHLLRRFLTD